MQLVCVCVVFYGLLLYLPPMSPLVMKCHPELIKLNPQSLSPRLPPCPVTINVMPDSPPVSSAVVLSGLHSLLSDGSFLTDQ